MKIYTGVRRSRWAFLLVAAALSVPGAVCAQSRTIWGTGYGATGSAPGTGFTVSLPGVTGTVTTTVTACSSAGAVAVGQRAFDAQNAGTPGFFSPARPVGAVGAGVFIDRDGTRPGCAAAGSPLFSMMLSLSSPVDAAGLRFHFLNLDAGTYQFGAGVSPNRLAGNNVFDVVGQRVNNAATPPVFEGCQANDGTNPSASCGSVGLVAGSLTITSVELTAFDVAPQAGFGDGHRLALSLDQPSLRIRKQRVDGTGNETLTFNYPDNVVTDDANGVTPATSETIEVTANGVFVDGQARFIANSGVDTVITEVVPAGQTVSGTCYDVANSNAQIAVIGADGAVTLPADAVTPTARIQCDFTNTASVPTVTVTKASTPVSGATVNPGATVDYTLTAVVANAPTSGAVTLTDTLSAGQTLGALPADCTANGPVVTCVLAAGAAVGTHAFTYPATVNADATGTIGNNVVPTGPDNPTCGAAGCATTHPIVAAAVTVTKASTPASGSTVDPGDSIDYTLTAVVANSATTGVVTLTDTLSAGQTLGALPAGCTAAGQVVSCLLAAGSLPGTYTFAYPATVNANATGTVGNNVVPSGPDNPACGAAGCATTHPIVAPAVTVTKSSNPPTGTTVVPAQTIVYILTATVANSATTGPVTLTDTLSAGQTVAAPLPAGCTANGQVVTCVLAAGALPGAHDFVYSATVNADATGTIGNNVVPSGPDNPTCGAAGCATTHQVIAAAVTVTKTSTPGSGSTVNPGDTVNYTLTVVVANSATTGAVTLTDTLTAGQTLGTLPAGCTAAGRVVTCVLAAGALPGSHGFAYPVTVNADATGTIGNNVVPSGPDDPTCGSGGCATTHRIVDTLVTVSKSSDPASGSIVEPDQPIQYTLTVTVANSATTSEVKLADTIGGDQTLQADSIVAPAGGRCDAAGTGLACTLAGGSLPGTYVFRYRSIVNANASGALTNNVAASGGGTGDPVCTTCATRHSVLEPVVTVAKASVPASGAPVRVGDTIQYTVTAVIENRAITQAVTLTDTPGVGLIVGALPAGCAMSANSIVCSLPAGTAPGSYSFTYPATIAPSVIDSAKNVVLGAGGGGQPPGCGVCATAHPVADIARLRIVKQASPRDIKIGDLVRYTLSIDNVGTIDVHDATLIDTPPPGFTYVADSLSVVDADGAGRLVGTYPIRVDQLDIRVGERARLQYLLRVGAGVRRGVHVNQAVVHDNGAPASNVAQAEVRLIADPLLDESLILGTVFDDRDGDGWQDPAALERVRVQGGFAADVYVAGSTTIDRGDGPKPLADASAPLLHGIELGTLDGRPSDADPAPVVVIAQTLREAKFTDDFSLTSRGGTGLRMDRNGRDTVQRDGRAAKGLDAAAPRVERRVARIDGGVRVEYAIHNDGVDERGIPGVRIGSVEGLLIETDPFGRYHLEGIAGGAWERGRNFILKVDPATLPPGTVLTTANPLLKRITPGLPVRFDFGAKLPPATVETPEEIVEMRLDEVIFEPGSARIGEQYAPVIASIAEQLRRHPGSEASVDANGETQALAYQRATAVRDALLLQLPPEQAARIKVALRAQVDGQAATLATLGRSTRLGTVLFDTDQWRIRPEFRGLIEAIAAELERSGGGTVSVVGYADVRGGLAANDRLGLNRAKAVQEAIAAKLSPAARAKLSVRVERDPNAPIARDQGRTP